MKKKILVVKHVEQEGPGLIEDVLGTDGWDFTTVELGKGETLPESLDDTAAVIVLGGPMNVYETKTFPFLRDEERLIRKALIGEIPFLGICLGAQLLAKTCGAKVKKSPEKEVGWYTANITAAGRKDVLFRDIPERMIVFQWHEDTFDVPDGGVLLATGQPCKNQAFRVGSNAYGLQFHIEVTTGMVREWMDEENDKHAAMKALNEAGKVTGAFRKQTQSILSNFGHIIESSMRLRNIMRIFVEDGKRSQKTKRRLWWNSKEHSLVEQTN